MTLAVFFPSLMGIGIIISGALLVSDWVRRLLPHRALQRRHNVVVGTYGAIADAVGAAGYQLKEPWFLTRGLRSRWSYLGISALLTLLSAGAMRAGEAFHDDPIGLFYRSPWAVGIGYGVGSALLVGAALCLVLSLTHRSTPRFLMPLISSTPLGRFILPSKKDQDAALNNLE